MFGLPAECRRRSLPSLGTASPQNRNYVSGNQLNQSNAFPGCKINETAFSLKF
jgi:hypothetical protein